jgi:P27 family predicted phage terminase small subunit
LNDSEPVVTLGGFSCPRYLNDEAKREWHRVVRDLKDAGVLGRVDRATLEGYCVSYARWRVAEKEIEAEGITVTGPKGGVMKNPAVTVAVQERTLMLKFMSELGMTPSSRSRLHVEPKTDRPTLAEVLFEGVAAETRAVDDE